MNKQQQKVDSGGQALQAGGDIIVHNGISTDQMAEIIVALTRQISVLTEEAREEQQRRFDELKNSLLDEFARPESGANPEAFSDPDFQYVLKEAHESFARRGDNSLKTELVNLIRERSTHGAATRVAQTLNTSIGIAGKLSVEEYSALVAVFFMQKVVITDANTDSIIRRFDKIMEPFSKNFPSESYSIEYLESIGCVSINRVISQTLSSILHRKYAHAFGQGFSHSEFLLACGDNETISKASQLIITYVDSLTPLTPAQISSSTFRFVRGTVNDLNEEMQRLNIEGEPAGRLRTLLESRSASETDVLNAFQSNSQQVAAVQRFWEINGTQQASPSMIGRALAHSAMVGKGVMEAPLEIWVK